MQNFNTFFSVGPRLFSPFWTVLFYFSMIVFGLGQQMALFHTVSSGLIAIRPDHFMQFESSLIFMSCLLGLVFCFPLATEVTNLKIISYLQKMTVILLSVWNIYRLLFRLHHRLRMVADGPLCIPIGCGFRD